MNSRDYYVMLSMIEGLGPRRLGLLLDCFGSAEQVWFAGEKELKSIPGIPPLIIKQFILKRKELDPEEELEKLLRLGIKVIFNDDPNYPALLKQIYDPPRVLYYRGDPDVLGNRMFGIVGARRATHYGLAVAENISRELSRAGLCIVSGMARGIDTAAHKGALGVSGPTVAVLGCGVDVIYPRENKKIMEEIIEKGIVLSEFPPGTAPAAGNFPQRNRVISGLTEGIMVVEAAEKSGSLITADFALEQGRDVFAVPGQVTNILNRGGHRLIKQGAKLVESAGDILEELGFVTESAAPEPKNIIKDLTADEKRIYNIVSDVPVSSELIIEKTGIKPSNVLSTLLGMELKGLVRQLTGQLYVRCAGAGRF